MQERMTGIWNQKFRIYSEPYFLNMNADVCNKNDCFNRPFKIKTSYVFEIVNQYKLTKT